jgi:protein MAK11
VPFKGTALFKLRWRCLKSKVTLLIPRVNCSYFSFRLYDVCKCSEIGSLLQHEGSITWLSFNGDCMFSASDDSTILVWQTGTWKCLHKLIGHRGPVSCVSVHPSGRLALSVGRDHILRTWNLSTGFLVFRQKLKQAAQLVEWSQSAQHYALAYRTTIDVHNVESGAVVSSIRAGHTITSFIFTQDAVLAVACEAPAIQLFSVPTGDCSAKLEGHTQRAKGLAVSPDCMFLFSASTDGSIRAWKLLQPLEESVCVGVYETGSRLNCITLTTLKQTAESGSAGGVCKGETPVGQSEDGTAVKQRSSTSSNRLTAKHRQHRQIRVRSYARRTARLPFDRRKLFFVRRHLRAKWRNIISAGINVVA